MEQEKNKYLQEDQAWFDALSGKSDSGQGAQLRRTLREIELADVAQEDLSHDWQRLKFALRRETAQQGKKSGSGLRFFAIAASVLLFAFTVKMLIQISDVPDQLRKDEGRAVMRGVSEQVIFSVNPSNEADQLETKLLRLGVKVVRSSTTERIELNIPLLYPVSDEVRAALEAHIIPVPDQGDLSVVFIHTAQ